MRSETGYIGSFLLHATLVGVCFLGASMSSERKVAEEQDPLLLEVWKGDGSERDPGIPGADRGIAEGVATGDKSKMGLGGRSLTALKRIDAKSFIKDLKEAEAKAAESAKDKAEKSDKTEKSTTKKDADGPSTSKKSSSKRETLDDFNKSTGKTTKGGKVVSGGTSTVGGAKGHTGKAGQSGGDTGTGRGTGADGFGRVGGKGKNGGDGGSGNADKLFIGGVKGAFADIYIPLFREKGGDMASARDEGVVRVSVSASGLVSFVGWVDEPSDPLVKSLVIEAIHRMKPVKPHPSGETTTFHFGVGAKLTDA